jgi:hypothetical protein
MNGPTVPAHRALNRRLVLGAAFVLALLACAAPTTPVHAQPTPPAASKAAHPAADAPADESAKAKEPEPATEVTVGPGGITVDHQGKHVRVFGIQSDKEYDSFSELADDEPWLAGLIFFSVACVFAVPVLIVIAIVWYKMRRARMLNETMLKLAEKGVVLPAGALEALAASKPELAERVVVSSAPIAEQMRLASKRAAWSDLRKGIVMLAIGLALSLWSLLDDASANSVGLVLLFVGIGFIVLWWFEERQVTPPRGGGPATGA